MFFCVVHHTTRYKLDTIDTIEVLTTLVYPVILKVSILIVSDDEWLSHVTVVILESWYFMLWSSHRRTHVWFESEDSVVMSARLAFFCVTSHLSHGYWLYELLIQYFVSSILMIFRIIFFVIWFFLFMVTFVWRGSTYTHTLFSFVWSSENCVRFVQYTSSRAKASHGATWMIGNSKIHVSMRWPRTSVTIWCMWHILYHALALLLSITVTVTVIVPMSVAGVHPLILTVRYDSLASPYIH